MLGRSAVTYQVPISSLVAFAMKAAGICGDGRTASYLSAGAEGVGASGGCMVTVWQKCIMATSMCTDGAKRVWTEKIEETIFIGLPPLIRVSSGRHEESSFYLLGS